MPQGSRDDMSRAVSGTSAESFRSVAQSIVWKCNIQVRLHNRPQSSTAMARSSVELSLYERTLLVFSSSIEASKYSPLVYINCSFLIH